MYPINMQILWIMIYIMTLMVGVAQGSERKTNDINSPKHLDINCTTLAEEGNCMFYWICLQHKYQCDLKTDYPIAYAYKYCSKFEEQYDSFTKEGKIWVDEVKRCLMVSLLNDLTNPELTCDSLTEVAYRSHISCYLESKPNFCDVAIDNIPALCKVDDALEFFEKYFYRKTWKDDWSLLLQTMSHCALTQWSTADMLNLGFKLSGCINSKINPFTTPDIDSGLTIGEIAELLEMSSNGDCKFAKYMEENMLLSDKDIAIIHMLYSVCESMQGATKEPM